MNINKIKIKKKPKKMIDRRININKKGSGIVNCKIGHWGSIVLISSINDIGSK